jgi:hypothetical protein
MSTERTVFLVVRRVWGAGNVYRGVGSACQEERVPVRGFASRAAAETLRAELDAEFRAARDPWTWFGENSCFDADAVRAVAVRLGLMDPATDKWDWSNVTVPTAEQRAELWAAVPDGRAYEVVEVALHD